MNKESLRTIFEAIGLISVVGSLILVATEIDQNNELMAAEARFNRLNMGLVNTQIIIENSEVSLASALFKPPSDHTAEEALVSSSFWFTAFSIAQWTFTEIPDEDFPVEIWKDRFNGQAIGSQWSDQKSRFSTEFIQYIDEFIIDR